MMARKYAETRRSVKLKKGYSWSGDEFIMLPTLLRISVASVLFF
jgi:hypothetical protein